MRGRESVRSTRSALTLPLPEVSMRRTPIAVTLVALALLAAACSSASGPAWTYAPPTPAPSVVASAGASGGPSAAAPSGQPSGEASGGPTAVPGGGGGEAVVIEAHNIAFTTPEVQAPADAPFTIDFRNGDAGTPHNVEIKDASGAAVFKGEVVTGVTEAKYDVPALAAGTYPFVCTVHPNMTGTLKVGG
jgi:plastocyanin